MINEINNLSKQLPQAIEHMKKWGKKYAEAQATYYLAKDKATVTLQSEGVPATVISLRIKGICSKELFDMEFSKTMYEATKENINSLKTQIRVLEQQISMEWQQAGRE